MLPKPPHLQISTPTFLTSFLPFETQTSCEQMATRHNMILEGKVAIQSSLTRFLPPKPSSDVSGTEGKESREKKGTARAPRPPENGPSTSGSLIARLSKNERPPGWTSPPAPALGKLDALNFTLVRPAAPTATLPPRSIAEQAAAAHAHPHVLRRPQHGGVEKKKRATGNAATAAAGLFAPKPYDKAEAERRRQRELQLQQAHVNMYEDVRGIDVGNAQLGLEDGFTAGGWQSGGQWGLGTSFGADR